MDEDTLMKEIKTEKLLSIKRNKSSGAQNGVDPKWDLAFYNKIFYSF